MLRLLGIVNCINTSDTLPRLYYYEINHLKLVKPDFLRVINSINTSDTLPDILINYSGEHGLLLSNVIIPSTIL